MPRCHRQTLCVAATLAVLSGAAGCSRSMLTAPEPEPAPAHTEAIVPAPPSLLIATSVAGPLAAKDWYMLKAQLVRPEEETLVAASRYQLSFRKGSLEKDEFITIQEYDRDVLDIQLGPHGTKFGEPVELSIDFSGSAADPRVLADEPVDPVVYWLNETENRWEEVPGTTDWKSMRHVVRLEHFSRYVVGGKAGWKHQPGREQD